MGDLISRQAAIDYFVLNVGFHDEDGYPIEDADELRKIWTEYFDGIPSAQPEIIRCKDCKHFAGEGMYCSCDIIVQFDHFYCYHAERRQDV